MATKIKISAGLVGHSTELNSSPVAATEFDLPTRSIRSAECSARRKISIGRGPVSLSESTMSLKMSQQQRSNGPVNCAHMIM